MYITTRKTTALLVLVIAFTLFFSKAVPADIPRPRGRDLAAIAAIVMCFETDEILFGYNEHMRWHLASVLKMMTVYMVYDAIYEGRFTLDCYVYISERAHLVSHDRTLSNVRLSRTGNYTVAELLDVVIVLSACGAADALAEKVGGGCYNEYLRMANARVRSWSLDARVNSAFGGNMPYNYFTPYGLAVLTRNTIRRFPEVLERTGGPYIYFQGRRFGHHVPTRYPGMDGFKTGSSGTAGRNFIGTAQQDGIRLISVVMRSTADRRFEDTALILDYGFRVARTRQAQLIELEARAYARQALLRQAYIEKMIVSV